jgi:tetratricopeptide (TPR) repeat protein
LALNLSGRRARIASRQAGGIRAGISERLERVAESIQSVSVQAQLAVVEQRDPRAPEATPDETLTSLENVQEQVGEITQRCKELKKAIESSKLDQEAKQQLQDTLEGRWKQLRETKAKVEKAETATKQELSAPPAATTTAKTISRGLAIKHWQKGYSYFNANNQQEAERSYREAIAADPSYAPAYNSLGRIAAKQGNQQEALRWYDKAIAANPHYAPALNNRALALRKLSDLHSAREAAKAALVARPGYVPAMNTLKAIEGELAERESTKKN